VIENIFPTAELPTPSFRHPLLTGEDGWNSLSFHLHIPQLIFAYRMGLFPWYNGDSPFVIWHFPPSRMVLAPSDIKVAKSMRPYFNQKKYSITINQKFVEVMQSCRETRHDSPSDSWIHYAIENAYFELHKMGLAHSIEVWDQDQQLVGGLYGVGLGKIFTGESMFHKKRDASKFALICLARLLEPIPNSLIDCQIYTPHLASMGAQQRSKIEFWHRLLGNWWEPLTLINRHFSTRSQSDLHDLISR
jgi:leucyl/phenylalanyl-tRNA--protein transferase